MLTQDLYTSTRTWVCFTCWIHLLQNQVISGVHTLFHLFPCHAKCCSAIFDRAVESHVRVWNYCDHLIGVLTVTWLGAGSSYLTALSVWRWDTCDLWKKKWENIVCYISKSPERLSFSSESNGQGQWLHKFSLTILFFFICIPAVHIISFGFSFLSRVDELNKLACLQCMGLHRSAGRALQRERRGPGFESRWSPVKLFFVGFCPCDFGRW